MSTTKEYAWIPKRNIPSLLSKFNTLASRATKNGLPSPVCEVLDEVKTKKFILNSAHDTGRYWFKPKTVDIEMKKVAYHGQMPVFQDWKFLASIEHGKDKENNNVNLVIGGFFLNEDEKASLEMQKEILSLNTCPPNCEHCELPRRRNQTFILENQSTGEIKQVGSTCIDDFLGEKALSKALWYYEMDALLRSNHVQDYVDNVYYGAGNSYPVELVIFVAQASLLVDSEGFVSRKSASIAIPTSDQVVEAFVRPNEAQIKLFNAFLEGKPHKQIDKAKEIIDFYQNIDHNGKEFIENIQQIIARGSVDIKRSYQTGVVAFLPEGHRKELEKNYQRKIEKAKHNNEHFGEIKQRGTLKLNLLSQYTNSQAIYPYVLMKFRDEAGHQFNWKASIGSAPDLTTGKTYTLDATITEHGEYKDEKYTRLTRCSKIQEVPDNAPNPEFLKTKAKKPSQKNTESSDFEP